MRQCSLLKSPKKEEQQLVPGNYGTLEEIKGFLGINNYEAKVEEDEDHIVVNNCDEHQYFGLDFFSSNLENEELFFPKHEEFRGESFNNNDNYNNNNSNNSNNDDEDVISHVKSEEFGSIYGFWEENAMEDTKASLNLNLNYEQVLEAWSNRGSLWAPNHHHESDHHPSLSVSNNHYMGEVPDLEDERTRRETSVLRYKEKRQNRLFSKRIRYEVRKLNADKRPRLKVLLISKM